MRKEDNPWILVPMQSETSKRKFEAFIKERTGKDFHVPKQYVSGLVMLLVTVDLKHFSLTNITSAPGINYHSRGVDDFVENYDSFKERFGKILEEKQKRVEKYL